MKKNYLFASLFFNRKNLFLRIFLYFSPQKKERTSKIRYIKVFRLRGIYVDTNFLNADI